MCKCNSNFKSKNYQYNCIINRLQFLQRYISAYMDIANKSTSFMFCSCCELIDAVLEEKT